MGRPSISAQHAPNAVLLSWEDRRACNGSGVDFFPDDRAGVNTCKKICRRCPVRRECLEYALDWHMDEGIWGGTTGRQRNAIAKARAREEVVVV